MSTQPAAVDSWFTDQENHGGIRPLARYNATQIAMAKDDYESNVSYRTDETLDLVHAIIAKKYIGQALLKNRQVKIDTISCTESTALLGCIYAYEAKSPVDLPDNLPAGQTRDTLITDYVSANHATTLNFISSWLEKVTKSPVLKYLAIPVAHLSKDSWKKNLTGNAGSHWTLLVVAYNTTPGVPNPLTVFHLNSADDTNRSYQRQARRYIEGINILLSKYRPAVIGTRNAIPFLSAPLELTQPQQQKGNADVVSCGIFMLLFVESLYRAASNSTSMLDTYSAWSEFVKYLCMTVPLTTQSAADTALYTNYQRPKLRQELDDMVKIEFTQLLSNTVEINSVTDFLKWLSTNKIVQTKGALELVEGWTEYSFLFVDRWLALAKQLPDDQKLEQIENLEDLAGSLNDLITAFDATQDAYTKWRALLIVRDNDLRLMINRILDPSGPFYSIVQEVNTGAYTKAINEIIPPHTLVPIIPASVVPAAPAPATTPPPPATPAVVVPSVAPGPAPAAPATIAPPTPATPTVVVPSPSPAPAAPPTAVPGVPASAAKIPIKSGQEFLDELNKILVKAGKAALKSGYVTVPLSYDIDTPKKAKNAIAKVTDIKQLEALSIEIGSFIADNRAAIRQAYAIAVKNGFTRANYDFTTPRLQTAYGRLEDIVNKDDFSAADLYTQAYIKAITARIAELQTAAAAAVPIPAAAAAPARIRPVPVPVMEMQLEPAPVLYSDQFLGRVPPLDEYERRENERPLTFRQRNAPGGGDSAADKYDRAVEARARDEFAAFADARRAYERRHRALVFRY